MTRRNVWARGTLLLALLCAVGLFAQQPPQGQNPPAQMDAKQREEARHRAELQAKQREEARHRAELEAKRKAEAHNSKTAPPVKKQGTSTGTKQSASGGTKPGASAKTKKDTPPGR